MSAFTVEMVTVQKDVRLFRRSLQNWYACNGRDLPWRRTRDPYAVLVSEVMLQQTQVGSVIPYYQRWLHRFPNFAALAAASQNDVLHAWQGLGYYARARNLHAAAKAVQDGHAGKFPRNIDKIRALPGIGRYTANAVATFAFDQAVPIVESNTARVLARLFDCREPIDTNRGRDALWSRAATLVPNNSARIYNSALMDLGALVCLPRPKCGACPVRKFCRAKNPEALPAKKSRPRIGRLIEKRAYIFRAGKILLAQSSTRWRGMWTLPLVKLDRLNRSSSMSVPIHVSMFPFTRYRVTLRVFRQHWCDASRERNRRTNDEKVRWFAISALDSIPIPSPHRRAIVDLVSDKRAKVTRQRRPSAS